MITSFKWHLKRQISFTIAQDTRSFGRFPLWERGPLSLTLLMSFCRQGSPYLARCGGGQGFAVHTSPAEAHDVVVIRKVGIIVGKCLKLLVNEISD